MLDVDYYKKLVSIIQNRLNLMVTCYVGIGSNLGDRQYYINSAIRKIRLLPNTRVTNVSRKIETLPEAGPAQGEYLNCVIEIRTDLSPHELLKGLQNIESDLGRIRAVKNGPRNIDLDILLYGNVKIKEVALCIPHPRMTRRGFVMNPLNEIAPDIVRKLKHSKKISKQKAAKKKKRL